MESRALPILQGLLILFCLVGVRILMRLWHAARERPETPEGVSGCETVLVVGLGALANLYLRSVALFAPDRLRIAGLLGHNDRHIGRSVQRHPILGTPEQIADALRVLEIHGVFVDRIVVATAFEKLSPQAQDALLEIEKATNINLEFLIDQARMGSSRLPGKALASLGGGTALAQCLSRAVAVPGADAVCLATSRLAIDDAVAEGAARIPGVTVFRGDETDVLSRYAGAAREMDADVVLRITCDCPLIDPEVCEAVLALRAKTGASYAANNIAREWPHGLDCEAFTRQALDAADREATDASDREHVGPWMRRHAGAAAAHLPGPGFAAARHRWTLDYPEDLAFFRALWPHLPTDRRPSWRDVMAVVEGNPEIMKINAKHAIVQFQ